MHLLITNDDGYNAVGIQTLARLAIEAGHSVVICAPKSEQSATSHCLSISRALTAHAIPYPHEGSACYAVDGSPVDCVRVARYLTDRPFDFCLSGINNGDNVGSAIYYSGTDGAAREAAMLHLPSIAVSLGFGGTDEMRVHLAKTALKLMEILVQNPMPRMTFCNLNAPALPPEKIKGIRLSKISDSFYIDSYDKRVNPRGLIYFWLGADAKLEPPKPGSDLYNLRDGYMTYTFVGGYRDNNEALPSLPEILQKEGLLKETNHGTSEHH